MRALPLLFVVVAVFATSCRPDPIPVQDPGVYMDESTDQDRDRGFWQRPGAVMDAMGDLEEKVIADIGAGSGFFARRLAPIADRVIAVEISDSLVNELRRLRDAELPRNHRSRLEPRLGKLDDPMLNDGEVDIVLFVNTLMYIDHPDRYLRKVSPALRENGRIVVVDWKQKDTPLGPPKSDRISMGDLEELLKEAGYHIISSDDSTLDYQYILVADKLRL